METAGKTVTGIIRSNNEDSIYVGENGKKLYIVADGMGGHNGGEIASKIAIDSFLSYLKKEDGRICECGEIGDLFVGGIACCNKAVYDKSLEDESLNGMGTTFTCMAICGEKAVIAHVGDSRAYLLRDKALIQLTKDHSYVMEMVKQGKITVEEAATHPKRNIITRAVGTAEGVEADIIYELLKNNDILVLCSDGISAMISDKIIEGILNEKTDVNDMVDSLIGAANANGGKDNISVIIIRYEVEA